MSDIQQNTQTKMTNRVSQIIRITLIFFLLENQMNPSLVRAVVESEPVQNIQAKTSLTSSKNPKPKFAPDRLIIKYRPHVRSVGMATLSASAPSVAAKIKSLKPLIKRGANNNRSSQALGTERSRRIPKDALPVDIENIYVAEVASGSDIQQLARELKKDPNVEYAEPDYEMKVQMVPNDPYFSSSNSWGQGYDDLWGIKKIHAPEAWDISQGEGIVVAVIDTGVDYNHPDLATNIWTNPNEIPGNGVDDDNNGYIDDVRGWDFTTCQTFDWLGNCAVTKSPDNDPMDGYGHGSHVSGTIAAIGNNLQGVIGVAPKAKIMPVKGLNDQGNGYISDLAAAVIYAADNGANILNNSWGGVGVSQVLTNAFNYADSKGVLSFASAGNSGSDTQQFTPANIPSVFAVAATTENDEVTSFSNYGTKVGVAAPGGGYKNELGNGANDIYNILSTLPDNSAFANSKPYFKVSNGYYRLAGTSMACPHVSGLAALLLFHFPQDSLSEIKNRIMYTADPFSQPPVFPTGTGRINAYKALTVTPGPYLSVVDTDIEEYSGNGNFIPEANEQAQLIVKLQNLWKNASSVTATLSTTNSHIRSISVSSYNFGALASSEIKDNSSSPFIIEIGRVLLDTPPVDFELAVNADGAVQNFKLKIDLGRKKISKTARQGYNQHLWNDKLVWLDSRLQTGNEIFLFDLAANRETQITNNSYGIESPDIYDNHIVWTANRQNNSGSDLYLFDLATGQQRPISLQPSYVKTPRIYGNRIAMAADYGQGNKDESQSLF